MLLRSGKPFRKSKDENGSPSQSCLPVANAECHPALLNDVVLGSIFRSLDYKSVKNCRVVCHKWKSVMESIFRKRTVAFFNEEAQENDFDVLQRLFSNSEVPITTLEISGAIPWRVSQMQSFFRNEGRTITKIKFKDQFNLLNTHGNPCRVIHAWPLITTTLKSFTYHAVDFVRGFGGIKTMITTKSLISLDCVSVTGGIIVLSDNHRICPKKLRLCYNKFVRNFGNAAEILRAQKISTVAVEEFVNLDRMEVLELEPPYIRTDPTFSMSIDLQGSRSLQSLTFHNHLVLKNWEASKWRTQKLTLKLTPFMQRTQMAVKELILHAPPAADISFFPPTIKKLVLKFCRNLTCSSPVNLPLLERLECVGNDPLDFLKHFSSCSNLVELVISGSETHAPLNVDYIPKSVKIIFIKYQSVFVGESILEFDTLVLENFTSEPKFMNLFGSCTKFRPKNLIYKLDNSMEMLDKKSIENFNSHFKRIIRFPKNKFETVVFGAFDWSSQVTFDVSYLSQWVDKRGRFYLFKNREKRGTAITLKDIHEIVFGDEKCFEDCKKSYWFGFERSIQLF